MANNLEVSTYGQAEQFSTLFSGFDWLESNFVGEDRMPAVSKQVPKEFGNFEISESNETCPPDLLEGLKPLAEGGFAGVSQDGNVFVKNNNCEVTDFVYKGSDGKTPILFSDVKRDGEGKVTSFRDNDDTLWEQIPANRFNPPLEGQWLPHFKGLQLSQDLGEVTISEDGVTMSGEDASRFFPNINLAGRDTTSGGTLRGSDSSNITEDEAEKHFREDPVAQSYVEMMDKIDKGLDKSTLTEAEAETSYQELLKTIESQPQVDSALAMAARIRLMGTYANANKPDMVKTVAIESMEKYPGIVNWKEFKIGTSGIDLSLP